MFSFELRAVSIFIMAMAGQKQEYRTYLIFSPGENIQSSISPLSTLHRQPRLDGVGVVGRGAAPAAAAVRAERDPRHRARARHAGSPLRLYE